MKLSLLGEGGEGSALFLMDSVKAVDIEKALSLGPKTFENKLL